MHVYIHELVDDQENDAVKFATENMFITLDLSKSEIKTIIEQSSKNENGSLSITFGPPGMGNKCDKLHKKLFGNKDSIESFDFKNKAKSFFGGLKVVPMDDKIATPENNDKDEETE